MLLNKFRSFQKTLIRTCFKELAFKVRKFDSFFYKMAKNYHLHWIAGRANIVSKCIIYIFFNFGRDFCGFFPMLFLKGIPLLVEKKF